MPVEPEPRHARANVPLNPPVAVSGDGGHYRESTPVFVVVLVLRPHAARVDHLNPCIVAEVERRADGELVVGVARSAMQYRVSGEFRCEQEQTVGFGEADRDLCQVSPDLAGLADRSWV